MQIEEIYLRKLTAKDADAMYEWMHDPKVCCWFQQNMSNKSKEDILEFISNANQDSDNIHMAISNAEGDYLGTVSLKNIDMTKREAEYAIAMRSCAQGRGIGKTATMLILKKGFSELGLQRIYLNVLSNNIHARKMYEKCGFIYEKTTKDAVMKDGKSLDLCWYSITAQ